jgi:hypothetical protein
MWASLTPAKTNLSGFAPIMEGSMPRGPQVLQAEIDRRSSVRILAVDRPASADKAVIVANTVDFGPFHAKMADPWAV